MAGPLYVQWRDEDAIVRIRYAVAALEQGRARKALRRAVNHTGDKTYTLVRRTLAKQMGLSAQKAFEGNGSGRLGEGRKLRKKLANEADLEFHIWTSAGPIPMKEFNARQLAKGWSAAPWGKRRQFRRAFAVKRWGGNLYQRLEAGQKSRFPIEKLLGPNVRKELVQGATKAAFHSTVGRVLHDRVLHEIMHLMRTGR